MNKGIGVRECYWVVLMVQNSFR